MSLGLTLMSMEIHMTVYLFMEGTVFDNAIHVHMLILQSVEYESLVALR